MRSTRSIVMVAAALALSAPGLAQEKKPAADAARKDIADHRTLAAAHENAARCLESGKPERECHDQLQKDCKSVGIGKYCGMRHRH